MRLSEERIGHIAHMIADAIYDDDLVDFTDEDKARTELKKSLLDFFAFEDKADTMVREHIQKMAKRPPEGSHEWQLLYERMMKQELAKKGL